MNRVILGAAILFSSMTTSAFAQQTEDFKLLAKDGESGDIFGSAIAINKDFVVVGASSDDGKEFDSGSLYIYNLIGNFIRKVTPDDAAAFDAFASAVSINDDGMVAISALRADDGKSLDTGAVYLYNATVATFVNKLTPGDGDAFDDFGKSIAMGPAFVAIGSPGHDSVDLNTGAVYLFDAIIGDFISKLTPNDGDPFDAFGTSIDIDTDNNILAVGAPGDSDNGIESGSVYLFDAFSGVFIRKITADDGAAGDKFGCSVAVKNNILAVGAQGDDDNGNGSGSAYIYDAITGDFIRKITPEDGQPFDSFATEIEMDSDGTVVIGAPFDDDFGTNSGSVYLYTLFGDNFLVKLNPSDAAAEDQFGKSIAVRNGIIYGGSIGDDDLGSFSGSAYKFALSDAPCLADLTDDGTLNFFDVSAFLSAFSAQDPIADFNNDGTFNFFDVSAFLKAFAAGCP